jgi:hypothetical protein
LSDEYVEIFDRSLEAYSKLCQKQYEGEAQYLTLLGHKNRFLCALNGVELIELLDKLDTINKVNAEANEIKDSIISELKEKQPTIGSIFSSGYNSQKNII